MEKNKEIEVSFVTDKQLWAELKALCSKNTQKFGHRFLIKNAATTAILNYVKGFSCNIDNCEICLGEYKNLGKRYRACLSEYKDLKERYKTMKIGFIGLAIAFVLSCTYQLLNYLGV